MAKIPNMEALRDEMLRLGPANVDMALAERDHARWDAIRLRFVILFDLFHLLERGRTEADLADVLAMNHERGGHHWKYSNDQVAEAWLAVAAFCATGAWPEGDVALLGTKEEG